MRKLLNTLYITTPEAYLARDGENVVIRVNEREIFRIPVHNIEGIVTFGYMGASPALMQLCAERNVGLSFLSAQGRFMGRVSGGVRGNVLLRRTHYRWADNPQRVIALSRLFVGGKIANSRKVVERFRREHDLGEESDVAKVSHDLRSAKQLLHQMVSEDQIRGVEGEAANRYFSIFNQMIVAQKSDFTFQGRSRRPPKDRVNAMLSFLYTLLAHDVQSALETVGLDSYVGFLHVDRPGRPSLALDLMEEMRAYLCDRLVLSLINRKQVHAKGFTVHGEQGVVMDDDTRKVLLTAWQQRKKEEITHPFLNEKIPIGLLPYVQATLLARYMRNDLDDYPVFLIQ